MRTLNTPPKNSRAASQPAIIATNVWECVNHTNMCREMTALKINACTRRFFCVSASRMNPIWAKSICHSTPGSPSLMCIVVVDWTRNPHRSTANRCSVRYGNHTALTSQELLDLHDRQRHLPGTAGQPRLDLLLTREQHLPRPRRARSDAAGKSYGPPPPAQPPSAARQPQSAASTSRTSTTLTSLNPIAENLHADEHDMTSRRADRGTTDKGRRMVP